MRGVFYPNVAILFVIKYFYLFWMFFFIAKYCANLKQINISGVDGNSKSIDELSAKCTKLKV